MNKFMGRKPGEQGWKEIALPNQQAMYEFVGDRYDNFELDMGISLFMSESLSNIEEQQPINLVLSYYGSAFPVYGNVFLAGTDDKGEPIPLDREQLKLVETSSHQSTLPSGLKLLHLFPGGFQQVQVEPLRALGNMLTNGIWTNNQSFYSQSKAI